MSLRNTAYLLLPRPHPPPRDFSMPLSLFRPQSKTHGLQAELDSGPGGLEFKFSSPNPHASVSSSVKQKDTALPGRVQGKPR